MVFKPLKNYYRIFVLIITLHNTDKEHNNYMASKYTILYQEDKQGGFSGQCLELPGAISEGETIKKLKANMVDAVYLALTSVNTDPPSPINVCLVYSGCDFDPIS